MNQRLLLHRIQLCKVQNSNKSETEKRPPLKTRTYSTNNPVSQLCNHVSGAQRQSISMEKLPVKWRGGRVRQNSPKATLNGLINKFLKYFTLRYIFQLCYILLLGIQQEHFPYRNPPTTLEEPQENCHIQYSLF